VKIFWGMTKNLLNKNLSSENIPTFGDLSEKEDTARLRAVSYNRKGVTGILSSIKTRYLAKVQKEIQQNPIVPLKINKNILLSKSVSQRPHKNQNKKSLLRMDSVLEKHNFMQKVISYREKEEIKNSEKFLILNLTIGERNGSPIKVKRKRSISRDDTATVIAFNSNNLVIQPKYMENKGSMCSCELWNEKDRQRVAKKYESKIVDATRLPIGEMGKAYIGIYKPQKFETERVTRKMLIEHKNGMDVAYTDQLRAEVRAQMSTKKLKKSNSTSSIIKKDHTENPSQGAMPMLKLPNINNIRPHEVEENENRKENTPLVKNLSTPELSQSRVLFLERIKLIGKKEEQEQTQNNESPFFMKNELSVINKTGNEVTTDPTYLNPLQEGDIPIQTEEIFVQDFKPLDLAQVRPYDSLPADNSTSDNKQFLKTKLSSSPKTQRRNEKLQFHLSFRDEKSFKTVSFSEHNEKGKTNMRKSVENSSKPKNLDSNEYLCLYIIKICSREGENRGREKKIYQANYKNFMSESIAKMSEIRSICQKSFEDNRKIGKYFIFYVIASLFF